uniref:Ig-like domain-containing protein n=1 Tax=Terrapene triunguis TaxID=2587831 RepID=A0A674K258_9SAUR
PSLCFVSPSLTACLFVNPEGSLPKPSISVSPGGVIPVGGNVTIRCRHQRLGLRFLLYKAGVGNYPNYTDPAGSEAEFPITSARREHGGSYTCPLSDVAPSVTGGSFSLILSPGEVCAHRGGSWSRRWGGLGGPWLLGELVLQPGPGPGGSSVPCPDERDPDGGRAGGRGPSPGGHPRAGGCCWVSALQLGAGVRHPGQL